MATMEEILARKAAEELAKEKAGETREQADNVDQQAERVVENQMLDPNSPAAIKQSLEKSALVGENPQDALNVDTARVLESVNLIDHQGRTSLDTPIETGMQTSAGGVAVRMNDPRLRENQWNRDPQPDSDLAGKSKGVYRSVDIVQFYRPNGEVRKADANGFFYARTDEDVELLEHYSEVGAVSKWEGGSSSGDNASSARTASAPSPTSAPRPTASPAPVPTNRPGSGAMSTEQERAMKEQQAKDEQTRKDILVAQEKAAADKNKEQKK